MDSMLKADSLGRMYFCLCVVVAPGAVLNVAKHLEDRVLELPPPPIQQDPPDKTPENQKSFMV